MPQLKALPLKESFCRIVQVGHLFYRFRFNFIWSNNPGACCPRSPSCMREFHPKSVYWGTPPMAPAYRGSKIADRGPYTANMDILCKGHAPWSTHLQVFGASGRSVERHSVQILPSSGTFDQRPH